MELNKKCLDLMAYLRARGTYATVEELAGRQGVSARAVRYSLEKLEQYMVAHGLPYLERERGLGVRLVPDEGVYRFADRCAGLLVPYQYTYAPEERQLYLRLRLLLAEGPVTADELCRALECARNTVFKDLEGAEAWLAAGGLRLTRRSRVGLYAEGDELARRELATELILDGVPVDDLVRYTLEEHTQSKASLLTLESLLPPHWARLVNRAVRRLEALLEKQFSDETFADLLIRLAVLLRRAAAGARAPETEGALPLESEYRAARTALEELSGAVGVALSQGEVRCYTCALLGAKTLRPELGDMEPGERAGLEAIARRMVDEMETIYDVSFGDQEDTVVRDLLLHLRPAVYRIRYGLYNKNPLYREIVANYNPLFINTRVVCGHLEEYVGRPVSDHEVAYVALHFGAALHRINKRTSTRARVLLVCGTGLGSAKLIQSQVEKRFNVEIVDTVSGRAAASRDLSGVDCVITTIPITEVQGCRAIRVSPMFTEEDQQRVAQHLTLRYTPKERYDLEVTVANRLLAIVEKYCVVTDRLHLQSEFLSELMNQNRLDLARRPDEYCLSDLLTRERVLTDVVCRDWRESVAASAEVLERQGVVLPAYKGAIIRALEELGPYMVMVPGMALAHARPEDGVLGMGMSLVVLRTPVEFGYAEHDPVRVVVCLAAVDDKKHLKAMAQLFRLFKDAQCQRILWSGDREAILGQIEAHSR